MYYDIHTHRIPSHRCSDVTACYNVIVGRDRFPEELSGCPVSCGIHPWYIRTDDWEEQYARFRVEAGRKNVRMIGEAGLDREVGVPFALQRKVFEAQAEYAEETGRPVLIHCVKAWDELLACRKEWKPSVPWIVHGFRKKGELAAQLIGQGFYLSFGKYFQESALRQAWPDRCLLETDEADCPIEEIYRRAAAVLQIPVEEGVRQVEKNVGNVWMTNEKLNF